MTFSFLSCYKRRINNKPAPLFWWLTYQIEYVFEWRTDWWSRYSFNQIFEEVFEWHKACFFPFAWSVAIRCCSGSVSLRSLTHETQDSRSWFRAEGRLCECGWEKMIITKSLFSSPLTHQKIAEGKRRQTVQEMLLLLLLLNHFWGRITRQPDPHLFSIHCITQVARRKHEARDSSSNSRLSLSCYVTLWEWVSERVFRW